LRFEDVVERALASLPPELAEAVRNVEIAVEEEHPEDPDLFGLYDGVPLPDRGDWAGALPDRIRIFRKPLVESFPDPEELQEEIRITVLHELAHYFGLDEDRLDDLGYSLGNRPPASSVCTGMRTLDSIHEEIEILSEERSELWHRLSAEYNPGIRDEIRGLDAKLDALWDEHRAHRARLRFGDREHIVARARVEERLERAA
jgi:predicted Zn-dependent protease with MMP-like domain